MSKYLSISSEHYQRPNENTFISLHRTPLYKYLDTLNNRENSAIGNQSFLIERSDSVQKKSYLHTDSLFVLPTHFSLKPLAETSKEDRLLLRDILKFPYLALYGQNGSGKTEFMRWITCSLAHYSKNFGKSILGDLFPFFINGKKDDFSCLNDLSHFISKIKEIAGDEDSLLDSILDNGQFMLIIDNSDYLDEMFFENIINPFIQKYNKVRVIFTAVIKVPFLENILPVYLLPFNESQRTSFIEKWFESHIKEPNAYESTSYEKLINHVKDEAYYAELANTPELLNMLCFSYKDTGMIGQQPHYLINSFIDIQLSTAFPLNSNSVLFKFGLDKNDAFYFLRKLAWMMQCGKINNNQDSEPSYLNLSPINKIDITSLLSLLSSFLLESVSNDDKSLTSEFLERILHSGLLIRDNKNIVFSSQKIQDYLSGSFCAINFPEWKQDENRMNSLYLSYQDPRWEGCFEFCKENRKTQLNKIIEFISESKDV